MARFCVCGAAQKFRHLYIGVLSVIIVRIDYGEIVMHLALRAKQRMRGSPRLHTSLRHGISFGQVFKVLEHICGLDIFGNALTDGFFKIPQVLLFDDKNNFIKSRGNRVMDGIVNDKFAAGADRINLLQPAVTASHPGSKNHQCHSITLLSVFAHSARNSHCYILAQILTFVQR